MYFHPRFLPLRSSQLQQILNLSPLHPKFSAGSVLNSAYLQIRSVLMLCGWVNDWGSRSSPLQGVFQGLCRLFPCSIRCGSSSGLRVRRKIANRPVRRWASHVVWVQLGMRPPHMSQWPTAELGQTVQTSSRDVVSLIALQTHNPENFS